MGKKYKNNYRNTLTVHWEKCKTFIHFIALNYMNSTYILRFLESFLLNLQICIVEWIFNFYLGNLTSCKISQYTKEIFSNPMRYNENVYYTEQLGQIFHFLLSF